MNAAAASGVRAADGDDVVSVVDAAADVGVGAADDGVRAAGDDVVVSIVAAAALAVE